MGHLWVGVCHHVIMTELSTAQSYLVRIYRHDSENPHKLTGQVEMLDGSSSRTPFTDLNELAAVLNQGAGKRQRRKTSKEQL